MNLFPKHYKGIAFDFLDDGSYLLNYVELSSSNKKLKLIDSQEKLKDIKDLNVVFNDSDLVQVNLLGKGIVFKAIEQNLVADINDNDKLISLVLPNADVKDFFVNTYLINNLLYIAICRKSLVDEVILKLNEINCYPANINIGPFYIDVIIPFIKEEKLLQLYSYSIYIEETSISTINKSNNIDVNQKFIIENAEVNSNLLILFSSIILFELNVDMSTIQHPTTIEYKRSVLFKRKFKSYIINTSLLFFIVLFLNFILYSYLFSALSQYNINSEQEERLINAKVQQKNKYDLNVNFIENKKWNKNYQLVEYIESIMRFAPAGISIKNLNYQLYDYRNKTETVYNKIYLNGMVRSSNQLNNWIQHLMKLKLFKDIKLISYTSLPNTSNYTFNLEIELQ